jgi:hypothetical protein
MLPPIDPEQARWLIERGEAAKQLMEQRAFLTVVDGLSNEHLTALMAAPPGPKGLEAREHHHLMHYALTAIVQELQTHVSAADEMKFRLQLRDEADDAARDNEDT